MVYYNPYEKEYKSLLALLLKIYKKGRYHNQRFTIGNLIEENKTESYTSVEISFIEQHVYIRMNYIKKDETGFYTEKEKIVDYTYDNNSINYICEEIDRQQLIDELEILLLNNY